MSTTILVTDSFANALTSMVPTLPPLFHANVRKGVGYAAPEFAVRVLSLDSKSGNVTVLIDSKQYVKPVYRDADDRTFIRFWHNQDIDLYLT